MKEGGANLARLAVEQDDVRVLAAGKNEALLSGMHVQGGDASLGGAVQGVALRGLVLCHRPERRNHKYSDNSQGSEGMSNRKHKHQAHAALQR